MVTLPSPNVPYYGGGQVQNPANVKTVTSVPSVNDTASALGTLAVNPLIGAIYALVSKTGGVATWAVLGGSTTAVSTLSGNTGTATPSSGNIQIAGTAPISTVASGSTVTVSVTDNGYPVSPYVVGPVGQAGYQTIQSALDAANADNPNGAQIFIQPNDNGTAYSENLTLYPNQTICSFNEQNVTISGTHTATVNGSYNFTNISFSNNSGNVFEATYATGTVVFDSCAFSLNSAVIVDAGSGILGNVYINNCTDTSASNAVIFGAAITLNVNNSQIGANSASTAICYSANINNSTLSCSIQVNASGSGIYNSLITGTIIVSNSAIVSCVNCLINSGSSASINIAAAATANLYRSTTICSGANSVIGTGTLEIIDIDFIGALPANTVTLSYAGTSYLDGLVMGIAQSNGQFLTSNGPGQPLSFTSGGGGGGVTTVDADTGSATPSVGVIDIAGGTNINTSASGNTITVNLDTNLSGVGSISAAGDLSIGRSNSGANVLSSVINSSNTASSAATFQSVVAGASAGDPTTRYTISGVKDWSIGVDNSDSDAFKISNSAALGTSDVFRVDAGTGNIAMANGITIPNTGFTAGLTNGQLMIGNTGNPASAASLTAGSGISVTPGAGTITIAATGSGSGDVVGPGSATDNALCIYDGTTGKLIKNSQITTNSNGDLTLGGVGGNITGSITTDTTNFTFTSPSANASLVLQGNGLGEVIVNDDFGVTGQSQFSAGWTIPQGGTLGVDPLILPGDQASIGTAQLTAGAVTVATANVTASSLIFLTYNAAAGSLTNPGILSYNNLNAGVAFDIHSSSGTDVSFVNWIIYN